MFRIDRVDNRIVPLAQKSFSALQFRERDHLQEWIAATPEALGEDLLIIQKEFSGFDGTQERLDLLALDTAGRLVIIENKLDDSGRDVIWQALKYAAYCSTLRTSQIIDIYQTHLGLASREEAKENIQAFLSDADSEDLALNPTGSQRVFLVAAQFRREVTATALWLLSKGVNIACFQITPYQSGDDLYLDVSQLIPTPQTGDFMIQLAEKSASDEHAVTTEAARYKRRRAYWTLLLNRASDLNVSMLARRSSSKDNWMVGAFGLSGIQYSMVITESEARVQFEFVTSSKTLNKRLFDHVSSKAAVIEASLEEKVLWRRMEDAKSSRIVVATPVDFLEEANWNAIVDWHLSRLQAMEAVMAPLLGDLSAIVRESLEE